MDRLVAWTTRILGGDDTFGTRVLASKKEGDTGTRKGIDEQGRQEGFSNAKAVAIGARPRRSPPGTDHSVKPKKCRSRIIFETPSGTMASQEASPAAIFASTLREKMLR